LEEAATGPSSSQAVQWIVRRRSLNNPRKGDKRGEDKHQDSGESDAKENIVHDAASPIHRSPSHLAPRKMPNTTDAAPEGTAIVVSPNDEVG
jgi:hypothetical protein